MIINPKYLIQNEIITFPATININKHTQQNGIDVDCVNVYAKSGSLTISEEQKLMPVSSLLEVDANGYWQLKKGNCYEFDSSFELAIPAAMGGSVIGRSTFNRSGILIRSSWFDSGFKGNIGGTIYCFNDCYIKKGTRIGQFIMHEAASASLYQGQYQKKQ